MRRNFSFALAVLTLLVAGCGPSPEEAATMTAAAWTPTPMPTVTPTFTPTPIPYDLTVKITNQDGNPVPGAGVSLPESGDDKAINTDEAGHFTWNALSGESGTLNITAQGYLPLQQAITLERGPNEVVVALERDPYGVLPSDACAAGETLLYVDDFQDQKADGWQEIIYGAPGWSLEPDPLDQANLAISAHFAESLVGSPIWANLAEYTLENGVWRMDFLVFGKFTGNDSLSFNWLHAREPITLDETEVFDSRYQISIGSNYFAMRRLQQPLTNFEVGRARKYPKAGEWHFLEIGTYQGKTEIWVDGLITTEYTDPNLLPPGGIDLEVWFNNNSAALYFDNISLCELSAPFAPMPTPTPAP